MPSQYKQRGGSPFLQEGDLETPFLDKELFVKEAEPELEARLETLISESPFTHTFEESPRKIFEPENYEEDTYGETEEQEIESFYEREAEPQEEDFRAWEDALEQPYARELEEAIEEEGIFPGPGETKEALYEFDTPVASEDITDTFNKEDCVSKKDCTQALKLAIEKGIRDENDLTNFIFFARHQELARERLDPKGPKFNQLRAEWTKIRDREVRPAIQKASEDSNLKVSGKYVAERDPDFSGETGKRFKELVEWAAREVDINPGLLAAVLLAEWDQKSLYLSTDEVRSFLSGVDDFFAQSGQLRKLVPAFSKVRFDPKKKSVNVNEHGRVVTTIPFRSGRDAALATAVYLKYSEIKLRKAMQKNGGDFDKLPIETQFALIRIAMAAGHGGIAPDGELIKFKKKNKKWIPVKKGEKGGVLFGVASRVERVLKGEDILVRKHEKRQYPSTGHITNRNATILVAQALHLSEWIFGIPLQVAAQPELETFEDFNGAEFEDDEFENYAEASYEDIDYELAEEVEHPFYGVEGDEYSTETVEELEDGFSNDDPYSLRYVQTDEGMQAYEGLEPLIQGEISVIDRAIKKARDKMQIHLNLQAKYAAGASRNANYGAAARREMRRHLEWSDELTFLESLKAVYEPQTGVPLEYKVYTDRPDECDYVLYPVTKKHPFTGKSDPANSWRQSSTPERFCKSEDYGSFCLGVSRAMAFRAIFGLDKPSYFEILKDLKNRILAAKNSGDTDAEARLIISRIVSHKHDPGSLRQFNQDLESRYGIKNTIVRDTSKSKTQTYAEAWNKALNALKQGAPIIAAVMGGRHWVMVRRSPLGELWANDPLPYKRIRRISPSEFAGRFELIADAKTGIPVTPSKAGAYKN